MPTVRQNRKKANKPTKFPQVCHQIGPLELGTFMWLLGRSKVIIHTQCMFCIHSLFKASSGGPFLSMIVFLSSFHMKASPETHPIASMWIQDLPRGGSRNLKRTLMFQLDNMGPHRQLSLWNIKCRFFWSEERRYYYNMIHWMIKIVVNENTPNMIYIYF